MSKVKKLYVFNLEMAKTLNIGQFNPSCKAFIKGLYQLSKKDDFIGITGEDLLKYCVREGLWATKQEPSKYHTTWAYYVKLLREKGGIQECGTTVDTNVEFLEESEEIEYDFQPADKE
jgi:hypothetical protein